MTVELSRNKRVVERYLEGFRRSDHEQILSCLTDDIVWTVFGAFRLQGKVLTMLLSRGPASLAARSSMSFAWSRRATR